MMHTCDLSTILMPVLIVVFLGASLAGAVYGPDLMLAQSQVKETVTETVVTYPPLFMHNHSYSERIQQILHEELNKMDTVETVNVLSSDPVACMGFWVAIALLMTLLMFGFYHILNGKDDVFIV